MQISSLESPLNSHYIFLKVIHKFVLSMPFRIPSVALVHLVGLRVLARCVILLLGIIRSELKHNSDPSHWYELRECGACKITYFQVFSAIKVNLAYYFQSRTTSSMCFRCYGEKYLYGFVCLCLVLLLTFLVGFFCQLLVCFNRSSFSFLLSITYIGTVFKASTKWR